MFSALSPWTTAYVPGGTLARPHWALATRQSSVQGPSSWVSMMAWLVTRIWLPESWREQVLSETVEQLEERQLANSTVTWRVPSASEVAHVAPRFSYSLRSVSSSQAARARTTVAIAMRRVSERWLSDKWLIL